mgnify:CR=1 FL=1
MDVPSNSSYFSKFINFFKKNCLSPLPKKVKKDEQELIENLDEYFSTSNREVMIPRTKMVTIEQNSSISEAVKLFDATGHSRIPVQNKRKDNIVGVLYAKDLFKYFDTEEKVDVSMVMRKALFASYSQPIHQLLSNFKKSHVHLAIVVDEHGGVDGLITIEDVLEMLVGDIPDEFDKHTEPSYEHIADGLIIMDANYPLNDFNEMYHTDFDKEGIETIGGYACHYLGKIPSKDEYFQLDDINFFVEESSTRTLLKLRLTAPPSISNDEKEE